MVLGRIIGGILGFLVAGPIGALLGFFAGLVFDKGVIRVNQQAPFENRAEVQEAFFQTVFPLLGRLAKSDGRISEEEISSTEHLMSRMGLSEQERKKAIELFKAGAEEDFDINPPIADFLKVCGSMNNLKQILLVYLITVAYADGTMHEAEEGMLQDIADRLGYSRFAFNHLMGMIRAQAHFYRGQQEDAGYRSEGHRFEQAPSQNELDIAYKALGVEKTIDDKALKKAYRKLMSEYHPDKLAGRGVPEDMVKLATERSQEIQSAYDLIKKSRKS